MKQKLTTSGCAALRRQLCSPSNFIDPDSEIVEKLTQAKAAYFWEGTAMELPGAQAHPIRHTGAAPGARLGGAGRRHARHRGPGRGRGAFARDGR